MNGSDGDDNNDDDSDNDGDRPPIVEMFTDESMEKDLELYNKFMIAR